VRSIPHSKGKIKYAFQHLLHYRQTRPAVRARLPLFVYCSSLSVVTPRALTIAHAPAYAHSDCVRWASSCASHARHPAPVPHGDPDARCPARATRATSAHSRCRRKCVWRATVERGNWTVRGSASHRECGRNTSHDPCASAWQQSACIAKVHMPAVGRLSRGHTGHTADRPNSEETAGRPVPCALEHGEIQEWVTI
jgi:hypothetical protein